jgi:hypothetical protein
MKKIDAVKIVRNIRDKHNIDIAGKSSEEMIDYFRKKARKIAEMARIEAFPKR